MNYTKKIANLIIFALLTQFWVVEITQTTPGGGASQTTRKRDRNKTTNISNNRNNRSNNRANRNNRNPKLAKKIGSPNKAAVGAAASVRNTNQQQQQNVETLLNYCINNPSDARCINNTSTDQTTTQPPVIVVK